MIHKDFIIIGKGIAGTITALEIIFKGYNPAVIYDPKSIPSTSIAGAVLNPHNIRKNKEATESDLKDFFSVINYYRDLEKQLGIAFLTHKPLINLSKNAGCNFNNFNWGYDYKYENTFYFNTRSFLKSTENFLSNNSLLIKDKINCDNLNFQNGLWKYKNISSPIAIFCEGAYALENAFTSNINLNKNHGDVLIIDIPHLDQNFIYQLEDSRLLPIGDNKFWMGTTHVWNIDNPKPDKLWLDKQVNLLNNALNLPFKILEHHVGKRPTTPGQILNFTIDKSKQAAYINGLGSKGLTHAAKGIKPFVHQKIIPLFDQLKIQ